MEYGAFFGNMTDDQRNAWAKLSTDEREEIKRALEQEEKMKKDKEKAERIAAAQAAQASARNYSGDQFNLFPELRGDSADTESDPLLLTDYRGQTGTAESLANIPPVDADAGLSETAISRRGPLDMGDYVADSVKSGAVGDTLEDLGLSRGLQSATDKINYANRVIDKDAIREKQGTDLAIKLQMEEEAARKQAEADAAQAKLDKFDAPRTVAPTNTLMSKLQDHIKNKSGAAILEREADKAETARLREEDARKFEGEYQDAAFGPEKPYNPLGGLRAQQEKKIKEADEEVVGEGGFEERWKKLVEKADEGDEKKVEEVKKTVEKAVVDQKPPPLKDGVKFDDRGYPIYAKGSEWGNKFKARFDKAVKDGESIFKWTGHDGKERSYTNDLATKTKTIKTDIKESSTIGRDRTKQFYSKYPEAPTIGRDRTEQFYSKYAGAKEVEKPKLLKKEVEKATTTEEKKALIGEAKEKDKRGPDRYFVDPVTGWAMCLT